MIRVDDPTFVDVDGSKFWYLDDNEKTKTVLLMKDVTEIVNSNLSVELKEKIIKQMFT